ncbi:DUF6177 family protein [Curtobacterium sp. MCLR17_007]|uniref:DUF6177 family protein n=1 Tax=Curtobacterium sp. MCLR17_007 TaxID=2175648 RepID=UPI000DA81060|nr:DUF6177 family protein [Curtobacterium sp. MCLR17_007]WIB58754.1 DUF6177 family protein [Curtobacterium sp. MCLR17_007]
MGTEHPLVDGTGDGYVVSETVLPVVALTPMRADLFLRAAADGRRVVVLTPDAARLTESFRQVLDGADGRWVVRAEDGALRDGMTGTALTRVADAFRTPGSGDAVDPRHLAVPVPDQVQFVVSASIRHRADAGIRLGRAWETFAALGPGSTPVGWGTHEPVEDAWDKDTLTAAARARMPHDARFSVIGSPDAPLAGSVTARRTDKGVEEVVTGLVGVGAPGTPGVRRAHDAATVLLADLCRTALPLVAMVFARVGSADLTVRPVLEQDPEPVAMLLGAPAVQGLGLDVDEMRERFGAERVGRPRVPSLVLRFRDGPSRPDATGWERLRPVVDHLGRDAVERLTGRDLGADRHSEEHPHAP